LKQLSLLSFEENNWTSDDWQTPDSIAIALSKLVRPTDASILEPCAGTGQISKFLPQDRRVFSIEISPSRYELLKINAPHSRCLKGDFFKDTSPRRYDLIISNPPFSRCVEFVERSLNILNLQNAEARILFLLPIDWNCSKSRARAWKNLDAHIHCEYRIEGRVAFLDGNGVPQSKRQVCDAVFDIRPGRKEGGVNYL
jgi:Methyltransferase small domain